MGATIATPLRRHRLVASSLTITGLTIVARLATAARELLVARQYGVSTDADGYFVAVALPAVLASAVWIALQVAAVPAEAAVRADGGTPNDLLVPLVRTVGRRLGLVSLGIVVLSWPIVAALGSGFDAHTASLARGLLVIMAPTVMLSGISGVLSGSLTAQRRFGMSVAGQVINGVVAIVAFLALRDAMGITAAAVGVLAGFVAEVVVVGLVVSLPWGAILAFAKDRPRSAAISTAVAMATPLVVATLVTSSSAIIDQGMAGTLPSGSVGALAYASRIVLFAAIPLVAISTAVFPALAEQIVDGESTLLFGGKSPIGPARSCSRRRPGAGGHHWWTVRGRADHHEQLGRERRHGRGHTVGLHADAPGVRGLVLVASRAHRAEPQPVGHVDRGREHGPRTSSATSCSRVPSGSKESRRPR